MLGERYDPVNLFDLVPTLQREMEPVLAELDRLLDDADLFQRVKADLSRRYPRTRTRGRHSTPVAVVLRMLVVRRLYDWSYEETEQCVSDSLVLRQFCRLSLEPAPDDTTLLRWAGLSGPTTLEQLNARVVALARRPRVTRGRTPRTDGTVVETTMHHPTDSSLLADGVRVVSRLVGRAKAVVGALGGATTGLFRNRTRSARRVARQIAEVARQRGEAAATGKQTLYTRLLPVTEASPRQARGVQTLLTSERTAATERLPRAVDRFVPLVAQVIDQTRRWVVQGETVLAAEKVVSLFAPHTAIIRRGQAEKPTECGRKVWLDEVDGGIISRYGVLDGHPSDDSQVTRSLETHQRLFGHPPGLLRESGASTRPRTRRSRARRA